MLSSVVFPPALPLVNSVSITVVQEDSSSPKVANNLLPVERDSAENEGITSGARGPALTQCFTQEAFSEILILAVESAMENLSLLNSLQGSSQNVPSQQPEDALPEAQEAQIVPSPTIIIVKELDEEQALQKMCPLQPDQFSECK